jgi:LmbE family N-acetylglucosaminyl deacetylase
MLVVAHPDDETVAMGGHLAALPGITIVHVTDGAPRDLRDAHAHGFDDRHTYARARRRELEEAVGLAGINREALVFLDFVDQETPRRMPVLARRLADLFRDRQLRLVFTHAFEGGHPDHDAVCFAVHAAADMVAPRPGIIDVPLYHAGAAGMVTQQFPPHPAAPEVAVDLDRDAIELKERMIARYATQRRVLTAFKSPIERFRRAPAYDFAVRPNGGNLFYERFPWGLDGAAWERLAREALSELGITR